MESAQLRKRRAPQRLSAAELISQCDTAVSEITDGSQRTLMILPDTPTVEVCDISTMGARLVLFLGTWADVLSKSSSDVESALQRRPLLGGIPRSSPAPFYSVFREISNGG